MSLLREVTARSNCWRCAMGRQRSIVLGGLVPGIDRARPFTLKSPRLRRGLLLKQQGSAYRLTWRLVPPPGAPVPLSPLETTLTQSESLPL